MLTLRQLSGTYDLTVVGLDINNEEDVVDGLSPSSKIDYHLNEEDYFDELVEIKIGDIEGVYDPFSLYYEGCFTKMK